MSMTASYPQPAGVRKHLASRVVGQRGLVDSMPICLTAATIS